MQLSEITREVIALGEALNAAREAEEWDDESPLISSGELATLMPAIAAAEKRFSDFLQGQPAAVIYLLRAMRYFGRGDFGTKEELLDWATDLSEIFSDPRTVAEDIVMDFTVPEYLEDALNKLAEMGINVDELVNVSA